jgi:hypothetical protein
LVKLLAAPTWNARRKTIDILYVDEVEVWLSLMADEEPDSGDLPKSDELPSVVIFLDVDGVILPFGDNLPVTTTTDGSLFPDSCLAALTLIASEFSNVQLVLSSTWRVRASFRAQIIESLRLYGRKFGGPLESIEFYDITDPLLHSTRQAEIDAWLQSNGFRGAWIALDDEDLVEGNENRLRSHVFRNRVIKTASHVGLTDDDAHQAVTLLRKQLSLMRRNGEKCT